MNKLIFKKFNKNLLANFLAATIIMSIIVWTIQAVNFFDFVTKDGHGIKVYFLYSISSIPKIVHRIIPFIFFVSLFYTILKYENKNELNIFWSFGITKIYFAKMIIIFSTILMIFQIILGSIISPKFQLEARNYLKNSDIDFFSSLIDEGKFINIVKDLTIFIKKKDDDNKFTDIFIEDLTNNNPRMIFAKKGILISKKNQKNFILFEGEILNFKGNKINSFEFEQINLDLYNYSSKTITRPKIQEIQTLELFNCIVSSYNYPSKNFDCSNSIKDEIKRELSKRIYKPIFLPIIAIFCCFILTKSKYHFRFNHNNRLIFSFTFILILFSEVFIRYSSGSIILLGFFLMSPLIILIISYCYLYKRVNIA
jgi:lipopolysaccharide export system permease protein